jgi:hypothetical protein
MTFISCAGRTAALSYSTNVHPGQSVEDLLSVLRRHVAPVARAAFGVAPAAVNLRLGMRQADELLGHPVLPSASTLSDGLLSAPPTPLCEALRGTLAELGLRLVSVNAFPIRDFHAARVKEQVYSPPWTDGGRSLYTVKIAKVLANLLPDGGYASLSVPSGTFKGYGDNDDLRTQCAHFITECARELARLERLTGKTVVMGLEPEPCTTGETIGELLAYFQDFIWPAGRAKLPQQLRVSAGEAQEIARKFVTVNLDLCHQAVEFEDSAADLQRLRQAGIGLSGLHLSAALRLEEPARHGAEFEQLLSFDEPRYLHQVVAKLRGSPQRPPLRLADLPDLRRAIEVRSVMAEEIEELRVHFHVPLCAEMPGPLASTRASLVPAVRAALLNGMTENFVVETYTWGVLEELARAGRPAAQALAGGAARDLNARLTEELLWAKGLFDTRTWPPG